MPFPIWQPIPSTTPVKDLCRTSLLLCTDDPGSGILLRCSPGLDDGQVTIVHATARRPNALRMASVDDDTRIAAEAQLLLGHGNPHVVAIPHIAWKRLGAGLPRRKRIIAVMTLLAATVMHIPPLALSPWVAVPLAVVLGSLLWHFLRERIPTSIASSGAGAMTINDVVNQAIASVGAVPSTGAADPRSLTKTRRWVPRVG